MRPEMLQEESVGEVFVRRGDVHVGVFSGVHYGCYGDAEIGSRAPEICGWLAVVHREGHSCVVLVEGKTHE